MPKQVGTRRSRRPTESKGSGLNVPKNLFASGKPRTPGREQLASLATRRKSFCGFEKASNYDSPPSMPTCRSRTQPCSIHHNKSVRMHTSDRYLRLVTEKSGKYQTEKVMFLYAILHTSKTPFTSQACLMHSRFTLVITLSEENISWSIQVLPGRTTSNPLGYVEKLWSRDGVGQHCA